MRAERDSSHIPVRATPLPPASHASRFCHRFRPSPLPIRVTMRARMPCRGAPAASAREARRLRRQRFRAAWRASTCRGIKRAGAQPAPACRFGSAARFCHRQAMALRAAGAEDCAPAERAIRAAAARHGAHAAVTPARRRLPSSACDPCHAPPRCFRRLRRCRRRSASFACSLRSSHAPLPPASSFFVLQPLFRHMPAPAHYRA